MEKRYGAGCKHLSQPDVNKAVKALELLVDVLGSFASLWTLVRSRVVLAEVSIALKRFFDLL